MSVINRRQAGASAREMLHHVVCTEPNKQMQDYSIERQGIPNLDFTGDLIGQSGGPAPTVKIYRTKAHKYIGDLWANQKYSQAQGDFDKPVDLINWFKSMNRGILTTEVEDAIEAAAKNDDGFKAAWNVRVE